MKPSAVLSDKKAIVCELVARSCTTNPRIFRSVVHGDDSEHSDLDLLVDALPGATLFDLGGLQEELEAVLDVRVDVRTPGDLPERMRGSWKRPSPCDRPAACGIHRSSEASR